MRIKTNLRYELKYVIDRAQFAAVLGDIGDYMLPDAHGDEEGAYQITSLYYDTPDYKAYWDKIEGHKMRRKVRVRVYGGDVIMPQTTAYLEIKQRVDKLMAKRRVALPYAEAVNFETLEERTGDPDSTVMRETAYLYRTLHLRPSAVVTYDRLAYEGGDLFPDLRVTFDTNLRGRVRDLSLLSHSHAAGHYFFPPDRCVLEVKVNRTVPYWLTRILSGHRCTLRRVSKYCSALETSAQIGRQQRIVDGAFVAAKRPTPTQSL